MNESFGNIYKTARVRAGFTQEYVSGVLDVDVRTLSKYEADGGKPPDETVKRMCFLYNDKHLAFLHLKQSPLADFLPDIERADLKSSVLALVNGFYGLEKRIPEIVNFAADGRTSSEDWNQCTEALKNISGAIMSLLLSEGNKQNETN